MNIKSRLSYNETSLIVNALEYYKTFCKLSDDEDFKKRFCKHVDEVKQKFEKLENQILMLNIKE